MGRPMIFSLHLEGLNKRGHSFVHNISRGTIQILKRLNDNPEIVGFGLPRWSEKISHLSYADDTILFCSANRKSVKMMMKELKDYENVSG